MDYERMIEAFKAESDQEAEDQETILAYIREISGPKNLQQILWWLIV